MNPKSQLHFVSATRVKRPMGEKDQVREAPRLLYLIFVLFFMYAKHRWMEGIGCRQRQLAAEIYKQAAASFCSTLSSRQKITVSSQNTLLALSSLQLQTMLDIYHHKNQ